MADRFEDLEVWQTAFELADRVYDLTDTGPFSRDFGLRNQIRRAAVSVMSNIAEGFESQSDPLFRMYLGRAKASAGEVRAQLYLAHNRQYMDDEQFGTAIRLSQITSRRCQRLIQYLDRSIENGSSSKTVRK